MVRIECKSENALSRGHATVVIYENNRIIAEVIAKVEMKQGADGGEYPCVTLVEYPI